MQMRLLARIAPTYGWLRVGSKGAAFGVKKINSTMARMANNMIEQLGTNVDVRSLPQ
jgi:hypothetical protein